MGSASAPADNTLYRDNMIKAWAKSGSSGNLVDGFNLTVTRLGVGMCQYTFRTPLTTADYAVSAVPHGGGPWSPRIQNSSATSFEVWFEDTTPSAVDAAHSVIVIGN